MSKWRNVAEKLPKRGQIIIVPRASGVPFCGKYDPLGDMNRCLDHQLGKWWAFDTWMPAPACPDAANQ